MEHRDWYYDDLRQVGLDFADAAEVATHIRDEHSTFAWIIEGLLERAGFRVRWSEIDGPTYADYCAEKVQSA